MHHELTEKVRDGEKVRNLIYKDVYKSLCVYCKYRCALDMEN